MQFNGNFLGVKNFISIGQKYIFWVKMEFFGSKIKKYTQPPQYYSFLKNLGKLN